MKKLIIVLISIFLLLSSFALGFYVKKHIYDKKISNWNAERENMQAQIDGLRFLNERLSNIVNHFNVNSIDFFLYDEDPKKFEIIHINKNGNVEYKGKVLYTDSGEPLNMDTAYTTTEFKVLFAAGHIEPREGCDPKDTDQNGTMGCYVDIPDNN